MGIPLGYKFKNHKGHKLSEETKKKISDIKKSQGIIPPSRKGVKVPYKPRKHSFRSLETRLKLSESHKGKKSHFWRGGLVEQNQKIRNSIELRLWREAVFERDNWTCQTCRIRGGCLEAHHIKPFALFPKLRTAIDNGITLCKQCHKKISR